MDALLTAAIAIMLCVVFLGVRHSATIVRTVRDLWNEAVWYEKCGLVLLFLPIPGPVDEIVGALVIRRILKRRAWYRQQIAEDTCGTHRRWCCPECFDIS